MTQAGGVVACQGFTAALADNRLAAEGGLKADL